MAKLNYQLPFTGRMRRPRQILLLSRWNPALAWLPVESLVHQQQPAYYQAINASTMATDSAPFIRLILGRIHDAVSKAVAGPSAQMSVEMTAEITARKQAAKTTEQILNLLCQQPDLTLAEVAQAIGRSTRTVERAAAALQGEGKLRYHGPKKGGHWEVT